jgi:DNA-binding IclR family transcriptional regulator
VVIAHWDLRDRIRPLLAELRNECRKTVHLAILDRHRMEVVYLEKMDGLLPIGMMSSHVGGRSPAHCTGVGKALLAFATPQKWWRSTGHVLHNAVRPTPLPIWKT